ncbi:MAG: Mu transposase C-terminal domain-containing protein [Desulfitobacteriaceae bacterium]|nr:Mu transposase C-terminal domain-containing protein [Desulfitobacteriaceae bacterium]
MKQTVQLMAERSEIWLTTSQAAKLEGISRQAAYKKATCGEWVAKKEKISSGGGVGGKGFMVALSSLSALARRRWYTQNESLEVKEETEVEEEMSTENEQLFESVIEQPVKEPINLAEVKALVGNERFDQMLSEAETKVKPVMEYLELGDAAGKTEKAEAIAIRHGISIETLYRRVSQYEDSGLVGLMRRLPRLGVGTVRRVVTEEVERLARAEFLQPNKPKVTHVYKRVATFCKKSGIEVPSRATIYRVIDDLKDNEPDLVCLAREGEEEYIKRFAEKAGRKEPEFVNQIWEGDHHRLDFFINYRGHAVRPWVTTWMDVTARTISGFAMSIQANGRTIGLALRHGILPKKLGSWGGGISKAMAASLTSLSWDGETIQENTGITVPICGLPKMLYIDNGEDYKAKVRKGLKSKEWEYSKEVRSTSEILNIETKFCTKYSPWAKGHQERWYGTLTDQFSRYIPGYCGSDNKHRPEGLDEQAMAERDELLDLEEATMLFEMFVNIYHNTVHGSLGMTPLQKYETTPKVREGIPDERTLDICLMDVEKAKVMTMGIQRFGNKSRRRWYSHPELEKYVGQTLVIRYDPNRIGELLIFNPKTGRYICTATNKELMEWDATKDDIQKFLKKRATRRKEVKERLRGYNDATLESFIADRQEGGPVMVTGESDTERGIRLVTGMEEAVKKSAKPDAVKPKKQKTKASRFDQFMREAGSC